MTTQQISPWPIEKVVVHPLVFRKIVDNHNRLVRNSGKRVVGVLLGSVSRGIVGVTNSYAVPFEEHDEDPSIWSFDCNHHESMLRMFAGLNAKEDVVGWYSTCAEIRKNDLDVHHSILKSSYLPNPNLVLLTIDVQAQEPGIIEAYYEVDKTFIHVSTEVAPPQIDGGILVTEMTPGGENGLVDRIARYYLYIKNRVSMRVSGYDTSLDAAHLAVSLEKHFGSCGSVENVLVPRHPVTNAITGISTTVVIRGEGAEAKALALNGSDVGGWIASVSSLPPEISEMSSGMSARDFAVSYLNKKPFSLDVMPFI